MENNTRYAQHSTVMWTEIGWVLEKTALDDLGLHVQFCCSGARFDTGVMHFDVGGRHSGNNDEKCAI